MQTSSCKQTDRGGLIPDPTPFDVFSASDGWFVIAAGNDGLFHKLCAAIDLPALQTDPRFRTNQLRCLNHETLKKLLELRLGSATCGHWQALLMQNNIPTGAYNDLDAVVQDPQVLSRDMLVQLQTQTGRNLTVAGNPIHVGAHRTPARCQPPQLDQDRDHIIQEIRTLQPY